MRPTHVRSFLAALLVVVATAACTAEFLREPDPTQRASSAPPAPAYSTPTGAAGESAPVEVETGHCFVEPVRFDGELWNVPFAHQFGWGGLEPDGWSGHGVMTRTAPDRAEFVDNLGAVVEFRPADHPSVVAVETAGCD